MPDGKILHAVIDGYSEEFLSSFMEHLRRCHPSTRVSAKVVYNEYIANKDHIHMNSTKWLTLTDFVKFLGREGYCKVDQTEKGWHLVYQKKDIEQELEEERKSKRHKAEKVASLTLLTKIHLRTIGNMLQAEFSGMIVALLVSLPA